jgi:hypothetical protein
MYRSSTLDFQYILLLRTIKQEKLGYSLFPTIIMTRLSGTTVPDIVDQFWDSQKITGSCVLRVIKLGTLLFKQEQFLTCLHKFVSPSYCEFTEG